MQNFRNLPTERAKTLAQMVSIQPGRVVSMAFSQNEHCQMTLLAFADGESVSEECYFGDTFYYVLEGEMPLQLEGQTGCLMTGDCIAVPAGTLHAIGGTRPFKVLQITIQ
jgi:quercetin dioxygenase-like cupin family protein